MTTSTFTPPPAATTPGEALRMLRQHAGVRLYDLAGLASVPRRLLADVEAGVQEPPSTEWLGYIADVLARILAGEIPAPGIKLHDDAVAIIQAAGIDPLWWQAERAGDNCGCADDRCIGFHHDIGEYCGCLPALIKMETER